MEKNMLQCPITSLGTCRFNTELVTEQFPKPMVFYAFDTATGLDRERQLLSRSIYKDVELAVRNCGLEFYAFNRENLGSSIDWLCEKVCLKIQNSALVIADISSYEEKGRYTSNPNVMFEIGMALGFRKKVILINGTPDRPISADLSPLDRYHYPSDVDNHKLEDNLIAFIENKKLSPGLELISSKSFYAEMLPVIESIKCDWLLASDYHSFLFRPLEELHNLAIYNSSDPYEVESRKQLVEKRWRNFRELLDTTDFRFIHLYEKAGLEDYFSTGIERRKTSPNPKIVTPEVLLLEIDESIGLLKKYHPKLQVGFTKRPLPYAFLVRPKHCVLIDSKSDLPDTLNAMYATYKAVVNDMENVFWDYWKDVPNTSKSLDATIECYEHFRSLVHAQKENNYERTENTTI
jgi:hypothetical protein